MTQHQATSLQNKQDISGRYIKQALTQRSRSTAIKMQIQALLSVLVALVATLAHAQDANDRHVVVRIGGGDVVITKVGVEPAADGNYKGAYRFPVDASGKVTGKNSFDVELKETRMGPFSVRYSMPLETPVAERSY